MSHSAKQRALEAYAEELLSPRGRARVEAHLGRCSVCRAQLSTVRAYALLREHASAEVAPALSWERLERALEGTAHAAPGSAEGAPVRTLQSSADAAQATLRAADGTSERTGGLVLDGAQRAQSSRTVTREAPERAPQSRTGQGARQPAPSRRAGRAIAVAWPVLAVAATLVIAWLGRSGAPTTSPDVARQPAAQVTSAAPLLALVGRVTLVAGNVQLSVGDHSAPVDLQSEIREGSLLVSAREAALHVALGAGTGFVLGPESRLRVLELRPGHTRLELLAGSVANQVEKLAPRAEYRVLTGAITASVRGTRFLVEQRGGTRVAVQEGLVEVARDGEIVALLSAGQSFAAPERASAAPGDLQIHELARAFGELRALHLPPLPQLRNWRIDGAALSAQGELAMRMPPGIAQLTFEDMRGQVRSVEIDVRESETRIDPLWLAKLVTPREPPRSGHLEPEQIAKVIKAGLDPLRRCYERSLRTRPALEARLTLAVRVGPDGRVQRASASGAEDTEPLPQELEQCIASEAGRLLFPKPEGGGSMSFEVPINLKAK
jgi:hypothetical protein